MDFMIDEELKPWLIEINTNPCLELSSPLLARLIPSIVDQTMRYALTYAGYVSTLFSRLRISGPLVVKCTLATI